MEGGDGASLIMFFRVKMGMERNEPTGAEMLKNRYTVEARVKELLEEYPQCRGDDLLLVYRYYQRHERIRIAFGKFRDIFFATCPNTISRSRRKIQRMMPELKPTKRVRRKRQRNEEAHRHYYTKGLKITDFMSENEHNI